MMIYLCAMQSVSVLHTLYVHLITFVHNLTIRFYNVVGQCKKAVLSASIPNLKYSGVVPALAVLTRHPHPTNADVCIIFHCFLGLTVCDVSYSMMPLWSDSIPLSNVCKKKNHLPMWSSRFRPV